MNTSGICIGGSSCDGMVRIAQNPASVIMIIVRLDATRCCAKSLINKLIPRKFPAWRLTGKMDRHELTRTQHFTNRANYVVAVRALKVWGS